MGHTIGYPVLPWPNRCHGCQQRNSRSCWPIDMVSRATTDWANFKEISLQNKPANFDNGSYYESVSYANYGLTWQYPTFRLAMQNVSIPGQNGRKKLFERAADYFMYTCYPADGDYLPSLYFGDSNIAANGMSLKSTWALVFQKTDIYGIPHRYGKSRPKSMPTDTPMGLLYTPIYLRHNATFLSLSVVYEKWVGVWCVLGRKTQLC